MTEKSEKDPIVTLAALDLAFGMLLSNIRVHEPDLAKALSMDIKETTLEIPLRLPEPRASATAAVLDKWRVLLDSDPTDQAQTLSS